ncbi:MAG: UDP-N-acetylmuramate dehydrogenase, partial [Acidimicrobiales bacterium]
AAVAASGLAVLVIGRGSNLLVADRGFAGIAVVLDGADDAFGALTVNANDVTAGAALPLPALARRSVEAGLTGLEWAVGVPGSVGGGVRMNAGGHGSDVSLHLRHAWVSDLGAGRSGAEPACLSAGELAFGYRQSAIGASHVVLDATFALEPGDPRAGRETIRHIVRWRREHQPGGQNAGSVFTNPGGVPPGHSAGWLVEAAGCKGRRLRSAMVSPKHANFIQADPGGSADDVLALMRLVRAEVRAAHGVDLGDEVRLVGFPEPPTPQGDHA